MFAEFAFFSADYPDPDSLPLWGRFNVWIMSTAVVLIQESHDGLAIRINENGVPEEVIFTLFLRLAVDVYLENSPNSRKEKRSARLRLMPSAGTQTAGRLLIGRRGSGSRSDVTAHLHLPSKKHENTSHEPQQIKRSILSQRVRPAPV